MEFLDGFRPVRPLARLRQLGGRAIDFGARHTMYPAESDRRTSNHIKDAPEVDPQGVLAFDEATAVARGVDAVVRAFPGTEIVTQPDDAA